MCKPKISFLIPSISVVLLSIFLFFPRITNAEKPTLPLSVEATLLNNPSLEGTAKIKVLLTSSSNIPSVSISCILPQGTGLLSGEEKWDGPIEKDKSEEIFYSIPVVGDKYYKIEFAATMNLNKVRGTIYAFVEINPHLKKNEASKKLKTKRLPDGKKIIEFKGE